jgi:hypothetical protein
MEKKDDHLPRFFDSQAQAAGALNVQLATIRQAKRDGCPAFFSGRIEIDPLQKWLRDREESRPANDLDDDEEADGRGTKGLEARAYRIIQNWDLRRRFLLTLLRFVDEAFFDGQFSSYDEYRLTGQNTLKSVLELGRSWKVWKSKEDEGFQLVEWFEWMEAILRAQKKIGEITGEKIDMKSLRDAAIAAFEEKFPHRRAPGRAGAD